MISSFVFPFKGKFQSISRLQALISFTALAMFLSPASVYGMDPSHDTEGKPQKIFKDSSSSSSSSEEENPKSLFKEGKKYFSSISQEDKLKAIKLFDRAAQKGSAKLRYKIAEKYDVMNEQEKRFKVLFLINNNPCSKQDLILDKTPLARAQFDLANIYYFDKKNTELAYLYYKLASANGWGDLPMIKVIEDEQAIQDLKLAADKNNSEAHYLLGEIYEKYKKNLKNLEESLSHYKTAAALGNAKAQFLLSEKYAKGEDVETNDPLALEYLHLAAAQNYSKANVALAVRFEDGEGVEKDMDKALKFYQIAADLGDSDAQFTIGWHHLNGGLLEENNHLALNYLTLAAEQKNIMAIHTLAKINMNGGIVPQNLEKALEYFESDPIINYNPHADQGYYKIENFEAVKNAWEWLALAYDEGILGVTPDLRKATHYCQRLADQGIAEFQNEVGLLIAEEDPENALYYFRLAANQGYADAQCNVGSFYENGLGRLPEDYRKAFKYYSLAADQGCAKAQCNVGFFYENGLGGLPEDYQKAFEYYSLAADQGYAEGQYNVGFFYENGLGVNDDYRKAFKYYTLAADQGYMEAQFKLGKFYKKLSERVANGQVRPYGQVTRYSKDDSI